MTNEEWAVWKIRAACNGTSLHTAHSEQDLLECSTWLLWDGGPKDYWPFRYFPIDAFRPVTHFEKRNHQDRPREVDWSAAAAHYQYQTEPGPYRLQGEPDAAA